MKKIIVLALLVSFLYSGFEIMKNQGILLGDAIIENGDFAANALQIKNAKNISEIYGNYSRWGFHHPGPAYFYIYGLGERVLLDNLKVVSSPHQAHMIAGIILQSIFVGIAIATIVTLSGLKKEICLEILAILLIYYSLAEMSFVNIWPPNVLLGPTLALYSLATAVSLGTMWAIPLLVTVDCFLIHGHVAQPLFVIPVTSIALVYYFIYIKQNKINIKQSIFIYITVAIAILFGIPLIIDLTDFEKSNINKILNHIFNHSKEHHHSIKDSVVYLSSFLTFDKMRDGLELEKNLIFSNFKNNIILIAAFVLCLYTSVVSISKKSLFFKRLSFFLIIGTILSFHWARTQNGIMYGFNSYFIYSIIALWIVVIYCSLRIKKSGKNLFYSSGLLILGFCISFNIKFTPTEAINNQSVYIEKELSNITSTNYTKSYYLYFDHDNWPNATCAALILDRLGKNFYVSENWAFMFGNKHVLNDNNFQDTSRLYVKDRHICYPSPLVPGTVIETHNNECVEFKSCDTSEKSHIWTTGNQSSLIFDLDKKYNFEGFLKLVCFSNGVQNLKITLNKSEIFSGQISPNEVDLNVAFDARRLKSGINIIDFYTPDAHKPNSTDPRVLGIALKSIKIL